MVRILSTLTLPRVLRELTLREQLLLGLLLLIGLALEECMYKSNLLVRKHCYNNNWVIGDNSYASCRRWLVVESTEWPLAPVMEQPLSLLSKLLLVI